MKHEMYINNGMFVLINRGRIQHIADNLDDIVLKIKEQEKLLVKESDTEKESNPDNKPKNLGSLFNL